MIKIRSNKRIRSYCNSMGCALFNADFNYANLIVKALWLEALGAKGAVLLSEVLHLVYVASQPSSERGQSHIPQLRDFAELAATS